MLKHLGETIPDELQNGAEDDLSTALAQLPSTGDDLVQNPATFLAMGVHVFPPLRKGEPCHLYLAQRGPLGMH